MSGIKIIQNKNGTIAHSQNGDFFIKKVFHGYLSKDMQIFNEMHFEFYGCL